MQGGKALAVGFARFSFWESCTTLTHSLTDSPISPHMQSPPLFLSPLSCGYARASCSLGVALRLTGWVCCPFTLWFT